MLVKERKEIALEDTWDLSLFFEDDAIWQEKLSAFVPKIQTLKNYRGQLHHAEKIREYFDTEMALSREIGNLMVYAHLRKTEDTRADDAQAMYANAYRIYVQFSTETSFARPEILSIDNDTLKEIVEDKALDKYHLLMRRLYEEKIHMLSQEGENVLASLGEVLDIPDAVADNLMDADMLFAQASDSEGKKYAMDGSVYTVFQSSSDRQLRKTSFESMYESYKNHINTFAATYAGRVKASVAEAKLRHYPSSRAMSLGRNEIPEEVYDNLIKTIHEHMGDMYRYVRLRKRLLGLEELHYYDLYAPLLKGSDKTYSYDDAKEMVLETASALGEEYRSIVESAFRDRWVDVYPNKGKSSGAFSSGTFDSKPYIMMNFTGTLDSVSTLAHEMGHSLHTYHSVKNQPYHYADYTLFVAEVASTVNENILIEKLLQKTEDPKERLLLLNQYLEGFKGTIYRQTMFAEFEKEAHAMAERGEALNATSLGKVYSRLVKEYFGEELTWDDQIQYEWSRIPHFYSPFYVYAYATGYSTAVALSEKILKEGAPAVQKYLEFLSMGSSKKPLEELQHAGVDLTSPEPIHTALRKFASVLDEVERIADSLGM